jgi:ribosomal protein S27AE
MDIQKLTCASCGADLIVPPHVERLSCAYCGIELVVQRGEGYAVLVRAERARKTAQTAEHITQTALQEGISAIPSMLKQLQLSQDLAMAQLQLSSIQAEIRTLNRGQRDRATTNRLRRLRNQENTIRTRIDALQAVRRHHLVNVGTADQSSQPLQRAVQLWKSGIGGKVLIGFSSLLGLVFIYVFGTVAVKVWSYLGILLTLILVICFYKSHSFRRGAYNLLPWLERIPGFRARDPRRIAIATSLYLLPISLLLTFSTITRRWERPPVRMAVQAQVRVTLAPLPTPVPPTTPNAALLVPIVTEAPPTPAITEAPDATSTPMPTAAPRALSTKAIIVTPPRLIGQVRTAVNLRAGPSSSFDPPVTSLPLDTQVEVLGQTPEGWLKVRAGDLEGWIRSEFVTLDVAKDLIPVVPIISSPTVMMTGTP